MWPVVCFLFWYYSLFIINHSFSLPWQYNEELWAAVSNVILDFLRLFDISKYARGKESVALDADGEAAAAAKEGLVTICELQEGHNGMLFALWLYKR